MDDFYSARKCGGRVLKMNCERAAASWDASLERRGAGEESPRLHDSVPLQRASTDLPQICIASLWFG